MNSSHRNILGLVGAALMQLGGGVVWADPVITEFMASNATAHADNDGAFSDWVEIYNPGPAAVNLNGWYLTDNAKKKTKWQFPAVTLQPDTYLVVYTSDKNRIDPAQPLHTNFSLSANGEYLGLVKPDGATVASEYNPDYPAQLADISYGVSQPPVGAGQAGYFTKPTPGARNGDVGPQPLSTRVVFSRASGPFTGSIDVELSGAAPGEKIRYLVQAPTAQGADVADPTAASTEYTGPIAISSSAIVRAAIFSGDDSRRGTATSAHYQLLADWDDFRVDTFTSQLPILVLDNHGEGALNRDDVDHPAWLHIFSPGSTPANTPSVSFQITASVRGFSSAGFPKKSYNFTLQDELGRDNAKPLLDLDSSADWAVVSPWYYDPSFIRNAYVYALSNRIGRWAPRTRFAELFFNANGDALDANDYYGVVVVTDRIKVGADRVNIAPLLSTDVTAPAITGGYIIKIDNPDVKNYSFNTDHNITNNNGSEVVIDYPKAANLPQAQRDYIRGYVQNMENALFADRDSGWATRNYTNYIDVSSWVDHHLLEMFVGNTDALQRSDYFYKDRGGKLISGPAWDFDRSMGSVDGRDMSWDTWNNSGMVDAWNFGWWGVLVRDPEFMQAWIDRWQNLRKNEFATDNLTSLVETLGGGIGPDAAARDAARWPDNQGRFGGFPGEIQHLKNWLTNRADWIDQQFVAPPAQTLDGDLHIFTPAPGAQLAYTLDGSDPRAPGGGLSATTLLTSDPLVIAVDGAFAVRCYNPNATTFPGTPWSSAVSASGKTGGTGTGEPSSTRLAALSSRGFVGTGDRLLIAGVAVSTGSPKRFLIRAVGPAIGAMGVPNALPDPSLKIFSADGKVVASNNGWSNGPDAALLPDISTAAGTFPLAAGSNDSALIATLPNGAYSVQISSASGQTGVGLAEVYELDENGNAIALSTRGFVQGGDGILIGGFVVRGSTPKRLLLRGVGPSLADLGVPGALPDPVLTLFQGQTVVGTNDDWGTASNAAEIPATSTSSGTFVFTNSKDSALLVTLDPGVYTVQLGGKAGTEGVGLLEIYEAPPP